MGKLQKNEIINNRYTVKKFIAKGGMGKTYLATDNKTGSDVALKVLSFSDIKDWKELELFEREINALKNIDHSNIPDYIDNFEIDFEQEKQFFLVQEYVKGKDLFEHIKSGRVFTLKEIKKIFETLCDILNYIHTLHPPIIHRDINPKNIILDESNKTYLVDFGAVGKFASDTIAATMSNTFVGTLGYMPPEQLYGKATPSSDLYSLGVTIIFLLTGKEPSEFKLKKMKLDYHSMVDIPAYLKDLLDKMIDPDDDNRMNNAEDVLNILKKESSVKQQLKGKTPDQLITELFKAENEGMFSQMVETINNTLDVNAHHSDGRSILKIAFDKNRMQIVKFLIDHGADVNVKYKGKGLLHDAVVMEKNNSFKGDVFQFAELLVKKGADIELKDSQGKTPLEYAYDYKSPDFKEFFLKKGAKDSYTEVLKKGFSHIPEKRGLTFSFLLKLISTIVINKYKKTYMFIISMCLIALFLTGFRSLGILRISSTDPISEGKIIKLQKTEVKHNRSQVYKYYYKFKDKENIEYENYSYKMGFKYKLNSKIPVRYNKNNPKFSIIEGAMITTFGNTVTLLFLCFLSLVLLVNFILLWFMKNFIKSVRLLKKGVPTECEIFSPQSGISRENVLKYHIKYFDEINNVKCESKNFIDSEYAQKNKIIPCLYLPGRKNYAMIIPPDLIVFKKNNWELKNKWELIGKDNSRKKGLIYLLTKFGLTAFVFTYFFALINYLIYGG